MKNIEKQFNQIFKDMGFITYGDNTLVNIFRAIFWSTIILIGIYAMLQLAWIVEYIQPGIWK
ncbi:MAG: hypothetical protein ACO3TG_03715 [Minisyncoccia bacterium]